MLLNYSTIVNMFEISLSSMWKTCTLHAVVFVTILQLLTHGVAATTLSLKVPVNPVSQDGIFSLHCQILGLQDIHEVTISRTPTGKSGRVQRLSMGNVVFAPTTELEERVFLAIRQLDDGSVVYFLSLTQVVADDAGTYACEIFTDGLRTLVSAKETHLTVDYLPDDPICTPPASLQVQSGEAVQLSCSSDQGSPNVDLTWKRTVLGKGKINTPTITTQDDRIISSVIFNPIPRDDKVVFICEMTSIAFPGVIKRCHIGPFDVHGTVNSGGNGFMPSKAWDSESDLNTDTSDNYDDHLDTVDYTELTATCRTTCDTMAKHSVMRWIISTVVIGVLALLFAIFGIILLFKYSNAERTNSVERGYCIRQHSVPESTYEIPVFAKPEHDVYMPLNKSDLMIENKSIGEKMDVNT